MDTTRYTFEENPTVFGKILRGELPNRTVYETDTVLAFHNIAPQADIHIVLIPKTHLTSLQSVTEADHALMGDLMVAVNAIAGKLGIQEHGYRIICNAGKGGNQEVPHLHIHILANSPESGRTLPGF